MALSGNEDTLHPDLDFQMSFPTQNNQGSLEK